MAIEKTATKGKKKKKKKNQKKKNIGMRIFLLLLFIGVMAGAYYLYTETDKVQTNQNTLQAFHQVDEAQMRRRTIEAEEKQKALENVHDRRLVSENLQKAWESLWLEEVPLTGENISEFATIESCLISAENKGQVEVKGTLKGIPGGDNGDVYLFALNTFDTQIPENAEPVESFRVQKITPEFSFRVNLNNKQANSRLFKKFVVAAKKDGQYVQLSKSRFITNPEAIAPINRYTPASTKKGILVDPNRLKGGELNDLGIKQAAYNIPLSRITGHTTSGNYPTIHYTYGGKTYNIDGQVIAEYDIVFGALSAKGIRTTAIILNDMNHEYPELVHPQARSGSTAPYVMFNGESEDGINCMAAMATYLAERYSGAHGTVSNWVIANEINARKEWNYMAYTDVNTYTDAYAKAFRVFYNAIKAVNSAAEIYMPLDQTWNRNLANSGDYDARDIIDVFNKQIKEKGNIDWQLAYHPYPVPLTNAAFWNTGAYFKKLTVDSVDTAMVNMANVHVVTDYLCREDNLMDNGEPRHVLLSEQGFTSSSGGEAVQAAAIAYAYFIVEANSHINGFLLNRETDSPVEVAQGLAFGITTSGGGRKMAYNVYKKIDTPEGKSVAEFAKSIIGISDWSSVVHAH